MNDPQLVMSEVGQVEAGSKRGSVDIKEALAALQTLPYKFRPYSSRYWGHPFHFLVSYPSKLKPSIAHFLVHLFSERGEVVLDPFSGVGTIPFEACSQGRFGIGCDVNPLAFYSTRAKVQPPTTTLVHDQLQLLESYVREHRQTVDFGEAEEEIMSYYHTDTLREILAARNFFLKYSVENHSFLAACMLHILHGNRPYALSRRSHNIMPWPPKGEFIYKPVVQLLGEKVHRALKVSLPVDFVKGQAFCAEVHGLPVDDSSIDCIVTSPPFHGNRDFLRMNRIRLWFCGWSYEKQAAMKATFIENQKDISVYSGIFIEFHRVLKPSRFCILHLGVVGKLDMATSLTPYAEAAGFKHLATIYEDTSRLESHGIRDRGATHHHQFLLLQRVS